MVYRPSSGFVEKNISAIIGAIIPASFGASFIGVALSMILILVSEGSMPAGSALELLLMTVALGFGICLAIIGIAFAVAFYLLLFGAPIAVLLGERIRRPMALIISLLDAALAALFVLTGYWLTSEARGSFDLAAFALVLCFALPAGYLYRRNIIAMRDEWEFMHGA